MYHDDKRRLTIVPVSPSAHRLLLRLANENGIGVNDYAGIILDEWSKTWKPTEKDLQDENRQFFWNGIQSEREKWMEDTVYRMAAEYNTRPSEERAERLQQQCDIAGIDYSELMAKVGKDPFSSIVAQETTNTKFTQCVQWITSLLRARLMSQPSERYTQSASERLDCAILVPEIKKLSEKAGYHWSMVQKVRTHINEKSCENKLRIASVRAGTSWAWRLDTDGQETGKGENVEVSSSSTTTTTTTR